MISAATTLQAVLNVVIYTFLGLLLFALAFFIMGKVTPFSLRKEIEEDQNVALAVVIASVIIGIAMIIVAAISG
jgi:putative membrane protein